MNYNTNNIDATTLSPVAGDEFNEGEPVELPPLQDIINYNYHHVIKHAVLNVILDAFYSLIEII